MKIVFLYILFFLSSVSLAEAKTLTIITWGASTQPSINARIVGKYMQKYMSDITEVELKVVPGAGGIVAANYIYNIAEKDGYTIGIISRTTPIRSLLSEPNAKFEPKNFTWLGSASDGRKDVNILVSNVSYKEKLIIGDNNSGDSSIVDFVNRTTNLKLNKVSGYKDQPEIRLSYERKEIDAFFNSLSGHNYNKVQGKILFQYGSGMQRSSKLLEVPTLMELAKNEESRYLISILELSNILTRPYVAPPDIPSQQAKKLRIAFTKTINDSDYIKEVAALLGIEASLVDWKQAHEIMNRLSQVEKDLLKNVLN